MIRQLRRWLPGRPLVVVADSHYAVLELLAFVQSLAAPVTVVTRLRLDATLYAPAPPRTPSTMDRPRRKGKRLPTLAAICKDPKTVWRRIAGTGWYSQGEREVAIVSDTAVWYHAGQPVVPLRWALIRDPRRHFDPQALLSTDQATTPEQIVAWFVQRWQLETTFEEARAHLGLETQRQWNDLAIARTTPVLLGLFSSVTLLADRLHAWEGIPVRQAAWYVKELSTFSDALAAVRRELWRYWAFPYRPIRRLSRNSRSSSWSASVISSVMLSDG
jgi:hypothetical protein